ncbi:AAA family ATPase [Methylobacterium sp. WL18]|uniref:AAA family ATPase n=1 Tax=Methylobacterium sp. WL18 TaxID=2603897 RepID=UPI0011C9812A|nr:AAA family ATPase [Methylobacterium sp. WL18]TXN68624.1 AAA family ATPase [Methylobacterium sp. WL18]
MNVKGEMAASYVKEILAEQAGVPRASQSTLSSTLKELFETFFPDKEFLGPAPKADGSLTFPVKTKDGNTHDLDELSSGEKEILYGYLRIRNSAPKNSIIILDEPELHLNPRLIRGLPQFYKKHLGEALNNQIWLVTHSDALLREVVGAANYNVFHMLPCSNISRNESQLRPLKANADLELALVDLVGDLAAYRPGGKVILFEGGGDSDFDRKVVAALFPNIQGKANLISGSNKARVNALHETLDTASKQGQLPYEFYAITDKDSDGSESRAESVNVFSWDVYHIENYFLEIDYIQGVLRSLGLGNSLTKEQIIDELRQGASETLPQLLRHELSEFANATLVSSINTGTDPKKGDLAGELFQAIDRSVKRVKAASENALSLDKMRAKELELSTAYQTNLADGSWVKTFRGRDILRRFAGKHASSVQYEVFRNLILSRMQDDNYQPVGMKIVINKIVPD